jgi:hypothetical protein
MLGAGMPMLMLSTLSICSVYKMRNIGEAERKEMKWNGI